MLEPSTKQLELMDVRICIRDAPRNGCMDVQAFKTRAAHEFG
jgi:hypothetical protein